MNEYWTQMLGLTAMAFGHWQLFLVLFLVNYLGETGIPFPLVLTGVLVLMGVHIAQGEVLGATALLAASVSGSMAGAATLFGTARRLSRPALGRAWGWTRASPAWLSRAERALAQADALTVAYARLIPTLALPSSLVAGTLRLPWPVFLGGVLLSELLWSVPFVAAGFAAGKAAVHLDSLVKVIPVLLMGVAGAFLAVRALRLLWGRTMPHVQG